MTRVTVMLVICGALLIGGQVLSGCAMMFQPQSVADAVKMIEATEGSGCTYFRGNSRPYADVSVMTIHTYGKNAPKYLDCLQAIPPEARILLFPAQ